MKSIWHRTAIGFILVTTACSFQADLSEELLQLLIQQESELNCRLAMMHDSIRGEWDAMVAVLDEKLPPQMPAEEKANMLAARNAGLIRMFQSYAELDEGVQDHLRRVEERDSSIAGEVVEIRQKLREIDLRKTALLEELKQTKGAEQAQETLQRMESTQSINCHQ